MNAEDRTTAIIVLGIVATWGIASLRFPKTIICLYRVVAGDSYARLLHPFALRALGVMLLVVFCVMPFGMLH